jgi:ATP-dependent Clp protease ATP-binding subunit ClpC
VFERYTESARRALFFSRAEAIELGARSIEVEHLLLGILRAGRDVLKDVLPGAHLSTDDVRKRIEARAPRGEKLPTSAEIPFSAETKDVLHYAAEEADRLTHNYIGTGHMLLGVLRTGESFAASILTSHGVTLDGVRQKVATLVAVPESSSHEPVPHEPVPAFGMIRTLVNQLAEAQPESPQSRELLEQIHRVIDVLQSRFS